MKTSFPYKEVYSREHRDSSRYKGYSIKMYVDLIAGLVDKHKSKTLLDYGCGKGYQYLAMRVHEKWGGILPFCYDIGVAPLQNLPDAPVDGIICTDVMEHISEDDVSIILDHIFSLVKDGGFVFFVIACRPARKKFKSYGTRVNVHLTVQPPDWWDAKIQGSLSRAKAETLDVVCIFDEAQK